MASENSANSSDEISAVQNDGPDQQDNDGPAHLPLPHGTHAVEISLSIEESDLDDNAESTWMGAACLKSDANNPINITSSPSANTNSVIILSSSSSDAEIQPTGNNATADLIHLAPSSSDTTNSFITFSSSCTVTTSELSTLTNTSSEIETEYGFNGVAKKNMNNNGASSSGTRKATIERKIGTIVGSPVAHTRSKTTRRTRSSTRKNDK